MDRGSVWGGNSWGPKEHEMGVLISTAYLTTCLFNWLVENLENVIALNTV